MVCGERPLNVTRRGGFFEDPFFKESWGDYSNAVRRIVDRFNHGWSGPGRAAPSPAPHYHSVYRSLRAARLNYSAHSAQFREEDGAYKMVMDVREFVGGSVTVRSAGGSVSVRGAVDVSLQNPVMRTFDMDREKNRKDREDARNGRTKNIKIETEEDAEDAEFGVSSSRKTLHRRFALPADADGERVTPVLSKDAVLTVTVPKRSDVRFIPVKMEGDDEDDSFSRRRRRSSSSPANPVPSKRPHDEETKEKRKEEKKKQKEEKKRERKNSKKLLGANASKSGIQRSPHNPTNTSLHNMGETRADEVKEATRKDSKGRRLSKYEEATEVIIPVTLDESSSGTKVSERANMYSVKIERENNKDVKTQKENQRNINIKRETDKDVQGQRGNNRVIKIERENTKDSLKDLNKENEKPKVYRTENVLHSKNVEAVEETIHSKDNPSPGERIIKICREESDQNCPNAAPKVEIDCESPKTTFFFGENSPKEEKGRTENDFNRKRSKNNEVKETKTKKKVVRKDSKSKQNGRSIKIKMTDQKSTDSVKHSEPAAQKIADGLSPVETKTRKVPENKHPAKSNSEENSQKTEQDSHKAKSKKVLKTKKEPLKLKAKKAKDSRVSPDSPGSKDVKIERGQSLMEDDMFHDCWSDYSSTLHDVLTRLEELSSELGKTPKFLATSPSLPEVALPEGETPAVRPSNYFVATPENGLSPTFDQPAGSYTNNNNLTPAFTPAEFASKPVYTDDTEGRTHNRAFLVSPTVPLPPAIELSLATELSSTNLPSSEVPSREVPAQKVSPRHDSVNKPALDGVTSSGTGPTPVRSNTVPPALVPQPQMPPNTVPPNTVPPLVPPANAPPTPSAPWRGKTSASSYVHDFSDIPLAVGGIRARPTSLPLFPASHLAVGKQPPQKRAGDYKGKLIDNPNNLPRCVNEMATSDCGGEVGGGGKKVSGGGAMTSQCVANHGERRRAAVSGADCLRASDTCDIHSETEAKYGASAKCLPNASARSVNNGVEHSEIRNVSSDEINNIQNGEVDVRRNKIRNVCLKTLKNLSHHNAEAVPHLAAAPPGESVACDPEPSKVGGSVLKPRPHEARPRPQPARPRPLSHAPLTSPSVVQAKLEEIRATESGRGSNGSGVISGNTGRNTEKLSTYSNDKGAGRFNKPGYSADVERIIEQTRKLSNINNFNQSQDGKADWYSKKLNIIESPDSNDGSFDRDSLEQQSKASESDSSMRIDAEGAGRGLGAGPRVGAGLRARSKPRPLAAEEAVSEAGCGRGDRREYVHPSCKAALPDMGGAFSRRAPEEPLKTSQTSNEPIKSTHEPTRSSYESTRSSKESTRSSRVKERAPEEHKKPPSYSTHDQPRRFSGFGRNVSSNNVQRMRDVWTSHQDHAPRPLTAPTAHTNAHRRLSGSASPALRTRASRSPSRDVPSSRNGSPCFRSGSPSCRSGSPAFRSGSPSVRRGSGAERLRDHSATGSPVRSPRRDSSSRGDSPSSHRSSPASSRHSAKRDSFVHGDSPLSRESPDKSEKTTWQESPLHKENSPPSWQESPLHTSYRNSPARTNNTSTYSAPTISSSNKCNVSLTKETPPSTPRSRRSFDAASFGGDDVSTCSSSKDSKDSSKDSSKESSVFNRNFVRARKAEKTPSSSSSSKSTVTSAAPSVSSSARSSGRLSRTSSTASTASQRSSTRGSARKTPASASSVHKRLYKRFRDASLRPDSETLCFIEEADKYKMVLDVLEFVSGEIEVLQDDKKLTVKGSVQKVSRGRDSATRTFHRTFAIPNNSREEDIDSALSQDGVLTINVPKKKERVIKIKLVD